jgi:hypothetical protein
MDEAYPSHESFVSSHPRLVGAGLVVLVGFAAFVLIWFEPHKLFIDDQVDQPIPVADIQGSGSDASSPSPTPTASSENAQPQELAAGKFRSLEHSTSGRAVLLELADGRRFLCFEELDTSNGPDLRVYLSEIAAGDDWYAYGERFVDRGSLKGNVGDQNYELPRNLDLSRFRSAVIWCRRFTVGFGVAPLEGL